MEINFNSISELQKAGFKGFKTVGELLNDSSILPNSSGVYLVINNHDKTGDFLATGTGGYFKGKNPNVTIDTLKSNWVDNAIIVYIGKATSLKARLKQYIDFGQGKNIGHYGGRYIWQLNNSIDLIICWKELISENPGEYESRLIQQFVSNFGNRPFANLKD